MAKRIVEEVPTRLDEFGHEIPDPTPAAMPAGFKVPETLQEQVQRLVRIQLSEAAAEAGEETFEESEDFDIPDDPVDPSTPFEEWFDPVLQRGITAQEFNQNFQIYQQRYLDAQERAWREMDQSAALRRTVRPGGDGGPPPSPRKAQEPARGVEGSEDPDGS